MRKLLFLFIVLLLVGCTVAEVPVTVIVTPESPTASPEPPTPTQENQDWIDREPINPNWWIMDGCTPLVFGVRQFCLPYSWQVNEDAFNPEEDRPAPDAVLVRGQNHEESYLEMRIDDLNYDVCMAQDRLYLDESDRDGELNYVFKLVVELDPHSDFDPVERPVVTFSIGDLNNPSHRWSSMPIPVEVGKQTFLWVVTPTRDYDNGVGYKWCFDINGLDEADLNFYEGSLIRAGRAWGNDIAEAFSAQIVADGEIVEAGEF